MREESGKGRKISVQQISKYFTEAHFKSEDFGMLSLVRFQTPEEGMHNCEINGICIAVVCSGSVKAIVNGISCELRNNSILVVNEDSVIEAYQVMFVDDMADATLYAADQTDEKWADVVKAFVDGWAAEASK